MDGCISEILPLYLLPIRSPKTLKIMRSSLLFSSLLLILVAGSLRAQTSLVERTTLSDLVIEGTVIASESFWNEEHTAIFTHNTVEVSKLFKGEISSTGTIELITNGGTVEDQFQLVTHSFQVSKGEEGIFFLHHDDQTGISHAYRTKNISGPFVRYAETKTGFRAVDRFGSYYELLRDLYDPILSTDHTELQSIRPNSLETNIESWLNQTLEIRNDGDPLIHFAFDNVELVDDEHVEFDIVVKTTEEGIRFAETDLYLSYTVDAFGENIVANEKIEAWKETIIEGQTYTMALNDENPDVVRLLVDHGFEPDSLYSLSQFFQKFVHVRLDIETIWQLASLSFDDLTVADQTIFYDPETQTYFGFDKIAVSDPVFPFLQPSISSITPEGVPAGTGQEITILGSNFGDFNSDNDTFDPSLCSTCRVKFRDGDVAGPEDVFTKPSDIVSWKMNEIRLMIPAATEIQFFRPASSGKVYVENQQGQSNKVEIFIPYSTLSFRTPSDGEIPFALIKTHPSGNVFSIDKDLFPSLRDLFLQGMQSWCSKTSIAWSVSSVDNQDYQVDGNDFINAVVPGNPSTNDNAVGSLVITGHFDNCEGQQSSQQTIYFDDIDIILKQSVYTSSENAKWLNVIKHELGHAHMLNHSRKLPTNTSGSQHIMFPNLYNFSDLELNISNSDSEGGNSLFSRSATLLTLDPNCNFVIPIEQDQTICGSTTSTSNLSNESVDLNIYPNPGYLGYLIFEHSHLESLDVTIHSSLGITVLNDLVPPNHIWEFDISKLQKGIYYIKYRDISSNVYGIEKVVVQ